MSVILQPQVAFPIVRQIANHTDSTVYYVRAVVRNASGDIIDTVNLASQGNQRYQTSWRVPADVSGQGAYISIVTSVYVDSGYASKSENYGDEETTYLIFDRVMPAMRGGGGGGLARRDVRDVIAEELDKRTPKPIKIPPTPKMRFDEVLKAVREATEAIKRVPTERTDLSGVLRQIVALGAKIDAKEVTPATDLSSLSDAISALAEKVTEMHTVQQYEADAIQSSISNGVSELAEKIDGLPGVIEKIVDEAELTIAPAVTSVTRKKKEEEPPFDVKKFTI